MNSKIAKAASSRFSAAHNWQLRRAAAVHLYHGRVCPFNATRYTHLRQRMCKRHPFSIQTHQQRDAHARVLLQRLCCQLVAVALWYIERLQRLVIHLCCCRGGRYNLHRCVRAHVARRARIFSVKCNFVHQRNFDCVAHARQQRQKLLWLTMFFVVAK